MNLLENRKSDIGIIEGRFITKTLNDEGNAILKDSEQVMRRRGFSSAKFYDHDISVNNNEMTYSHTAAERFVDMKTRNVGATTSARKKVKRSGKVSKKSHPVHNKPIWSHKRFIIRKLSFGFTEEVKNTFREQLSKESTGNNL